jgi:DNA-directed RNA polymerase subunit RPC12/RpoP
LTCARCGKRFKTKRALGVHALLHEAPRLACPHCPKMLHTSLYLKGE